MKSQRSQPWKAPPTRQTERLSAVVIHPIDQEIEPAALATPQTILLSFKSETQAGQIVTALALATIGYRHGISP